MKKTSKLLALLLAFVMVFGMVAPVAKAAEDKTTVILTKMALDSTEGWPKGEGKDSYDGSKIEDLSGYFGSSKVLPGIAFEITNDITGEKVENSKGTTIFYTDDKGQISVDLPDGKYTFTENKEMTKPQPDGTEVADYAAVPFTLELPMYKEDGSRFSTLQPLYVYPKNTVEMPTIDKVDSDTNGKDSGSKNIGDDVNYKVTTTIPKGVNYETFSWSDTMTEGLTFKGVVTVDGMGLVADDYKLVYDDHGFKMFLTESGLKKINDQAEGGSITLTYSATINENAKIDNKESNIIELNYGNRPDKNYTDVSTSDGTITVAKNWAGGTAPDSVEAIFDIYDSTGKFVKSVTLNAGNNWSVTETGLPQGTYTVVERQITGYRAENLVVEGNKVTFTNTNNNPNPSKIPTEPVVVVTGGKKFVKTNMDNSLKLANAEFIISRNNKGTTEYLAAKTLDETSAENIAYNKAEKEYNDAVVAMNEALAKGEISSSNTVEINSVVYTDKNSAMEAIQNLKVARDSAYTAANMVWTWVTSEESAYVFTTNDKGQWEVKGLAYGDYNFIEIKAPEGYANQKDPVAFKVAEGSYTSGGNINYSTGELGPNEDATQITNKKVTIPQTGGIGTVIFTVAGIAIMAAAAYVLVKNNKKEEETA